MPSHHLVCVDVGSAANPFPVAVRQETQDEEELNIAPKKANWDLKRDVEKKLEKLNRRTQRAIVEIIRERMAEVMARLPLLVCSILLVCFI